MLVQHHVRTKGSHIRHDLLALGPMQLKCREGDLVMVAAAAAPKTPVQGGKPANWGEVFFLGTVHACEPGSVIVQYDDTTKKVRHCSMQPSPSPLIDLECHTVTLESQGV